jgi:preprotein translocase subunit YajC
LGGGFGKVVLAKWVDGAKVSGSTLDYMNFSGLTFLLAAAAEATTQTAPNPVAQNLNFFLMMGVLGFVMWFMMIRPQQKRAKELAAMLKSLRAGDKIVTSSGIVGVVLSLKDKTVSIRSSDTKLEILKSAVAEVTERSGEGGAS